MWSSIEQIIKPESFTEALALQAEAGAVLFAGGSYLVGSRDKNIHTLLDINHLLTDEILKLNDGIHIGATCTLQQLLGSSSDTTLATAISSSCPSKNIRNQRTLGGEIAKARPNSDLLIYLYAAGAKLQINGEGEFVHIAKWDNAGIISKILIPDNNTKLERVAVLDSAFAFVIVAVNQTTEFITAAVGGNPERVLTCKTSLPPKEEEVRRFMDKVESVFIDDHLGSSAYKRQLVSNLLSEMAVTA